MLPQELRALKLQQLKRDTDCFKKLYNTFEVDSLGDIFHLRCKAQNIANTLLEIETLNEFQMKNKEGVE